MENTLLEQMNGWAVLNSSQLSLIELLIRTGIVVFVFVLYLKLSDVDVFKLKDLPVLYFFVTMIVAFVSVSSIFADGSFPAYLLVNIILAMLLRLTGGRYQL